MKINVIIKQVLVCTLYALIFGLMYVFSSTSLVLQDYLLFIVGCVIGLLLLVGDESLFSKYYNDEGSSHYLVTRSIIFLLILIPLSLFVITSSNSIVGTGLILSLCTNLLLEMWTFKNNRDLFHERFLTQINKIYTVEVIQRGIITFGIFILFLHIVALR